MRAVYFIHNIWVEYSGITFQLLTADMKRLFASARVSGDYGQVGARAKALRVLSPRSACSPTLWIGRSLQRVLMTTHGCPRGFLTHLKIYIYTVSGTGTVWYQLQSNGEAVWQEAERHVKPKMTTISKNTQIVIKKCHLLFEFQPPKNVPIEHVNSITQPILK